MNTQIILPPAYQRPNGKLYLSSTQLNLVNATNTLVELDTIPAAYKDGIENGVIHGIKPTKGFYSIVGKVNFLFCVADKEYTTRIEITGIGVICKAVLQSSHAGSTISPLCCLPCHYLDGDTTVYLYARSDSGDDTVDIDEGEEDTFLSVQRVR